MDGPRGRNRAFPYFRLSRGSTARLPMALSPRVRLALTSLLL